MKKILSIALTAAMLGCLCACGSSSPAPETKALQAEGTGENAAAADGKNYDKVSLKLSYATGDTGMDGLTAIEFERLVEEKSGGQVQIDRFPNCQLSGGDMVRHVEMMIAGGAFELAIISENSFSDVDQTFQVTSIPFTFANYDQAWEKADSTGAVFKVRRCLFEYLPERHYAVCKQQARASHAGRHGKLENAYLRRSSDVSDAFPRRRSDTA